MFYKRYESKDDGEQPADSGKEGPKTRMFARATPVFAAEQVEGYTPPEAPPASEFDPIVAADDFIKATGAKISHGGDRAFYNTRTDSIRMPKRSSFVGSPTSTPQESYYSTELHELGHWSGAAHRLYREFGKRFGDDAYSVEEITVVKWTPSIGPPGCGLKV